MIPIMDPALSPLPSNKIGNPQRMPAVIRKSDTGKKIRIGLNKTTILIISITVSMAVFRLIVLVPLVRASTVMGYSKTR